MPARSPHFLLICLPWLSLAAPRYTAVLSTAASGSTPATSSSVPLVVLRDETGGIEATIAPTQGGELCGLKVRHHGQWRELLYRACDYRQSEGWRGKAPLLWPATGGTYSEGDAPGSQLGTYQVGGHSYQMPFHGFVRDMAWTLERHRGGPDQASATLSIHDSEETRRHYPFAFSLSVEYVVRNGALELRYAVQSDQRNHAAMPFSIGNHITFRTPFGDGATAAGGPPGGSVRLRTPAGVKLRKDHNNFPTGETEKPPFEGEVALGSVVANPAVSLGGYQGEPYVVLADPAGIVVRMSHQADRTPAQPFVQFNLWGDAQAGYISPEPWVGAQNSLNLRRGLIEIAPGEVWRWRIRIAPQHKK
jgi:galactose mutarotase-like enzyme